MKIHIQTPVNQAVQEVWRGFNAQLFKKLSPPFPPVELLRFDGSTKGDEVHLELNFLLFKQVWISEIIEHSESNEEIYFVDVGRKLPFFLRYWQHKHRIIKTQNGTKIVDEIEFKSLNSVFTALLYPALFLQFLYRKPIYKKVFAKIPES